MCIFGDVFGQRYRGGELHFPKMFTVINMHACTVCVYVCVFMFKCVGPLMHIYITESCKKENNSVSSKK